MNVALFDRDDLGHCFQGHGVDMLADPANQRRQDRQRQWKPNGDLRPHPFRRIDFDRAIERVELGDDNVHPQHSWQLINLLSNSPYPFQWTMYPSQNHSLSGVRYDLYQKMTAFVRENL